MSSLIAWITAHPNRQPVRAGEVSKFLLSSLILLTVTISCGLPTEAYLYPPIQRTVDFDSGIMKFENSTENDSDTFLGYMLIYRFYLFNSLPVNDINDTDEWNDIGEAFFTTSVLNTYDKENERGYYSTANNYSLFKVLRFPMVTGEMVLLLPLISVILGEKIPSEIFWAAILI